MHALNTILFACNKEIITPEEFDNTVGRAGAHGDKLQDFAVSRKLFTEPIGPPISEPEHAEDTFLASLVASEINDSKGFIFTQPCGVLPEGVANLSPRELHEETKDVITHYAAFVRGSDGDWHVAESLSPNQDFSYPGTTTATEAFSQYLKERHGSYKHAGKLFTPEVLAIYDELKPGILPPKLPLSQREAVK